ncbi:MAG: hypothetical protein ACK5JT_17860 [Hyphomicrobiaceae bacterium]
MGGKTIWRLAFAAAMVFPFAGGAVAIQEGKHEKVRLKACQKSFCQLVTGKASDKGPFTCDLKKTWRKKDLKDGSKQGKVSWLFGDASCSLHLRLSRKAVTSALKDQSATVHFADHAVTCFIDDGKKTKKVTGVLAPKVQFEKGKVSRVWVNLKKVDGPMFMKGLAFAAAGLEDKVGIFNSKLAKAINDMIYEKCPKVVSGK